MAQIIINSDIDKLRVGVNRNELFAVTPNHKPPAGALWAIGMFPLVVAVYVCHYFLNLGGSTAPYIVGQSSAIVHILTETRSKIVIIGCALCLSTLLTLRLMSAFALVCNYPLHEMTNLCSFAHDIIDIIRARHGPDSVWLTQGTLIGALRADKSKNYMILNDHDFDTCYDKRLEPVILETVKAMGVTYERFSRTYSDVDTHIRIYPQSFSLLSGHSGPLIYELQACEPAAVEMVTGCNGLPVPIPSNYDAILTAEYGPDWRIPYTANHGALCKIFKNW